MTFSPQAAIAAYDFLHDPEVILRLGLSQAEAARLSLALVADAESAMSFANAMLAQHANPISDLERQERFASAQRVIDEKGETVFLFELSDATRRCIAFIAALRIIAHSGQKLSRVA